MRKKVVALLVAAIAIPARGEETASQEATEKQDTGQPAKRSAYSPANL